MSYICCIFIIEIKPKKQKMSKEKETDAATVLSQMSQLVGVTPTFDFPPSQDSILEADAIGATCTLQPSSLGM